ncbi:hypothetical protein AUF78_07395 [archaeon 13_1_20CM_2_51_12]|nr:MAG: hypothetical protein AUF78_07395 [archaeon 13_1_20CM_2_51_12]
MLKLFFGRGFSDESYDTILPLTHETAGRQRLFLTVSKEGKIRGTETANARNLDSACGDAA